MPRILSLNDDLSLLQYQHRLLRREGYEHRYTTSTLEALAIMQAEPIDLFIQDIVRPHINGFKFYWLMKFNRELWDIPILIHTLWSPDFVIQRHLSGKVMEGLICAEFRRIPSKVWRSLRKPVRLKKPNRLYIEGYLFLLCESEKFLSTVREILHKQSLLSLTEEEKAARYEQLWNLNEGERLRLLAEWK